MFLETLAYNYFYIKDLHARLTAEFGEELSETLSHLMHPLAVTDAEVLYGAMKVMKRLNFYCKLHCVCANSRR